MSSLSLVFTPDADAEDSNGDDMQEELSKTKPSMGDASKWEHGRPIGATSEIWSHYTIDMRHKDIAAQWCQCIHCFAVLSGGSGGSTGNLRSHRRACRERDVGEVIASNAQKVRCYVCKYARFRLD